MVEQVEHEQDPARALERVLPVARVAVPSDVRLRGGGDEPAQHHVERDRQPDPEGLDHDHERQPGEVGDGGVECRGALERARVRVEVLEQEQADRDHAGERVEPLEREIRAIADLHVRDPSPWAGRTESPAKITDSAPPRAIG